MGTLKNIDKYLLKNESNDDFEDFDPFEIEDNSLNEEDTELLIDLSLDLILELDPNTLTDDQAVIIEEILDIIDPEELDEAFKTRKRRDLKKKRQRRREYRRKKSSKKLKGRKYRRSAAGKQTARKAKRKGKFGRTSTGKRQSKFVGANI